MSRSMAVSPNTLTAAPWAGDSLGRDYLVPGGAKIDASQFHATDAVQVVVGAAGAAADAVAVPVGALTGPIPSGAVLDFGGKKFARLTAAAAASAVSLTVAALGTALVEDDSAFYSGVGKKSIRSGTVVGRTIAERDAGTALGVAGDADDEYFIVAFDVTDASDINDVELARPFAGLTVRENFLPDIDDLSAAVKTALRARYVCVQGVD